MLTETAVHVGRAAGQDLRAWWDETWGVHDEREFSGTAQENRILFEELANKQPEYLREDTLRSVGLSDQSTGQRANGEFGEVAGKVTEVAVREGMLYFELSGLTKAVGSVPGLSGAARSSDEVNDVVRTGERRGSRVTKVPGASTSGVRGTPPGTGGQVTRVAPKPPNRVYSARELKRRASDIRKTNGRPGPNHNFPQSFDEIIFEQGERRVVPNFWEKPRPGLSNDSVQYTLPGNVNGVEGTYEIFVRPSVTGRTEIINHRFFRPTSK